MLNQYFSRLGKVLALSACLSFGLAMAQSEPTLTQIYDAAKIGNVDKAQVMVQQVLIAHPNSARAHFVQAELFARQGQMSRGRESLQAAEKLAPGLPFAKAEAVQALRTQLASRPAPVAQEPARNNPGASTNNGNNNSSVNRTVAPVQAPASSGFPLGLGLALGGAAIALVIFLTRKKATDTSGYMNQAVNPNPPNANFNAPNGGSGLNGPQAFGQGQPSYGQAPYGQPGYGQPAAGSGMGGRLAGGLATGLAVGAGVMAAEAIGKNMMGGNAHAAVPDQSGNNYAPPAENNGNGFSGNNDMGGNDFGMNDTGSWDDGGSSSADSGGGGGDWDT